MATIDFFSTWSHLAQLWWGRHGGVGAGGLPRQRLELLVRFARENSPFYRERYDGLPAGGVPLEALPPVTRVALMARFDEWATDPRITLASLRGFLADRGRIGERFLDQYYAWKSSGTGGSPGIFVQDSAAMAVYDALLAAQLEDTAWAGDAAARMAAQAGRAALVVATGEHFASIASWERMRRALPELVAQLDEFRPAFLAAYPSVLSLLAAERRAGRLHVEPALVWSGGEHLAAHARREIEAAFGCPVMNEYGASECLGIAHECREGWMHLHDEWVILEPVDRGGLPTPPGELSHTALLTNLANWTQPLIRYDLGDRLLFATLPCECGSRLPAFHVEGRTDDIVALRSARGTTVRLAPLAISTVVEQAVGEHHFQVVQTGPERLALRVAGTPRSREVVAARRKALGALKAWLATQSLPNVELTLDARAPRPDVPSGKLRNVIATKGDVPH